MDFYLFRRKGFLYSIHPPYIVHAESEGYFSRAIHSERDGALTCIYTREVFGEKPKLYRLYRHNAADIISQGLGVGSNVSQEQITAILDSQRALGRVHAITTVTDDAILLTG